jgi:hypothetical protein
LGNRNKVKNKRKMMNGEKMIIIMNMMIMEKKSQKELLDIKGKGKNQNKCQLEDSGEKNDFFYFSSHKNYNLY